MGMSEINAKYIAMIGDFKMQCDKMLGQSTGAFEEITKSANTNFENMKNSYKKGSSDMRNEILKGNLAMVESFRKNCKIIQQNIDDSFNALKGENMDLFAKNLTKFQQQSTAVTQKHPNLSSTIDEVISYLSTKQHSTLEQAHATHKVYAKQLQESYDDTARKLTMTEHTFSSV